MTLRELIQRETANELGKSLVKELCKFSDDEEYIAGVLLDVKNEEDKEILLRYIQSGDDVDYEQIILNALWLNQQRKK